MLLIVFIDQHCKPESNILLIRVQGDGNSLPAYGLAEMNIEIPIKDTQQVQYGFPAGKRDRQNCSENQLHDRSQEISELHPESTEPGNSSAYKRKNQE